MCLVSETMQQGKNLPEAEAWTALSLWGKKKRTGHSDQGTPKPMDAKGCLRKPGRSQTPQFKKNDLGKQ